jgi:glyoxylase-like metal-dependent hydrolase (beta-lactamase superfamily II)
MGKNANFMRLSLPSIDQCLADRQHPRRRHRLSRLHGEEAMKRILGLLAIGVCASVLVRLPAAAQTAPEMSLTRFECGTRQAPTVVNQRFSDTFAFPGKKVQFVFSCYLIKHGDEYMLWDTGHSMTAPGGVAPKTSLVDFLAQLNLKPEQIKYVGISHFHADHTGQVASFPGATLLIGQGDWAGVSAANPPPGANAAPFKHWVSEGGKVEPLVGDKDVFGDGTVMILNTPGHTPGHHSIMVKLAQMGNVMITGDLAHFHENYDTNGVPGFNFDRAQTLASLDRFKKIAKNFKATVIIQHDARDVGKLPAFPTAAK